MSDIERRKEVRYPGHEEDLETAKAHMLEMLEQLSPQSNEFGSDEINQKINEIKQSYDSIHRLEDLMSGEAHLEQLLKEIKHLVKDQKRFDEVYLDLKHTQDSLRERLMDQDI